MPTGIIPCRLQVVILFVKIGTHNIRVADRHVVANDTAQTDHAVFDRNSCADPATIGDQAAANRRRFESGGRQIPGAGINWLIFGRETERRILTGQAQVRFVKRPNRSNVFPVSVKQVHLDMSAADRGRKDLFAEITVVRFVQHFDQRFSIEDVDTQAGHTVATLARNSLGIDPCRIHAHHF